MKTYILIPLLLAPLVAACTPASMAALDPKEAASASAMPVKEMEQVLGMQGHVTNDVLKITVPLNIGDVQGPVPLQGSSPVTFTPDFEIHGELYFQMLGAGRVLLNGYLALLEPDVNPFITGLQQQGIVFQAFSHHVPMFTPPSTPPNPVSSTPQVWYVHFHEISEPMTMARAIRAAMDAAHIAPVQQPPNQATPLDAQRLARILNGTAEPETPGGVVTVTVPRTDRVALAGVRVSPYAGISTTIEFKPTGSGANAQVCPDFSMTSAEVNPVVKRMLIDFHWYQGSLRNNEIDEQPQLFYDAMIKEGDAYQLAREIRAGLDLTHTGHGKRD